MMKTTSRARNGFFFAVMALAMLSLMLMTVQVWVKTFEQSDYRASQRFKGEAVRSILASLSDQTLSNFAHASAYYATYKMVNYTSVRGQGLLPVEGRHETNNTNTGSVENITIALMINGSSPPTLAPAAEYSDYEKSEYTLAGWQNKTDAAANAMGFDIQFSDARNFEYYQIDAWTVRVSFDMEMNITDIEGTMRQNKTMHAESSFPITGFLDPMITRKDMEHRAPPVGRDLATEKQIFRLEMYQEPANLAPNKLKDEASSRIGDESEGNGWFFGPITEKYPQEISLYAEGKAGINTANIKQYVLVSRYNASLASVANSYGAVIVTEKPVLDWHVLDKTTGCNFTVQTRCLNCMRKMEASLPNCKDNGWEFFQNNNPVDVPVIAVNNWNTNDVTPVTRAQAGDDITEQFVLIDNEKESKGEKMDGYHRVLDITRLRDMAICGFYVKGKGPSFFQRMLAGNVIQNPDFGIESFVVGQWAGGALDQDNDIYSRLDWEFYTDVTGNDVPKIKGMMGCKSKEMCGGANATEIGVGKFRLSRDAIQRYKLEDIYCKDQGASPC